MWCPKSHICRVLNDLSLGCRVAADPISREDDEDDEDDEDEKSNLILGKAVMLIKK